MSVKRVLIHPNVIQQKASKNMWNVMCSTLLRNYAELYTENSEKLILKSMRMHTVIEDRRLSAHAQWPVNWDTERVPTDFDPQWSPHFSSFWLFLCGVSIVNCVFSFKYIILILAAFIWVFSSVCWNTHKQATAVYLAGWLCTCN